MSDSVQACVFVSVTIITAVIVDFRNHNYVQPIEFNETRS